jgi:hypothetical protein
MNRFKTLLLREWMQHQRGWWVLMGLPTALLLLAALFGEIHFEVGDKLPGSMPGPVVWAAGSIAILAILTMSLAWTASMIQSPGLARRDVQDRSIEFWLSLPTSHSQSVGAMLLMHLLLVPWMALLAGLAGGLLVSVVLVVRLFGPGDWFTLPWGSIAAAMIFLTLRVMLGLLLASLWLSPLTLGVMAASAWLKRWGLPVVVGSIGIGGVVLDRLYGSRIVWDVLDTLSRNASRAFIATDRGPKSAGLAVERGEQLDSVLALAPSWLLHDLGQALLMLATPSFLATLAAGAAAFYLLVLRRQRGA